MVQNPLSRVTLHDETSHFGNDCSARITERPVADPAGLGETVLTSFQPDLATWAAAGEVGGAGLPTGPSTVPLLHRTTRTALFIMIFKSSPSWGRPTVYGVDVSSSFQKLPKPRTHPFVPGRSHRFTLNRANSAPRVPALHPPRQTYWDSPG